MNAAGLVCAFVANALWQSTLLVLLAWGVLRLFHKANATTRYAAWFAVLVASLALPIFTTVATAPRAASPTATAAHTAARINASGAEVPRGDRIASQPETAERERAAPTSFSRGRFTVPTPIGTAVAWAWLAIATAQLVRLAVSLLHIERLKRDALPLAPDRRARLTLWNRAHRGARDVRLCVSDRTSVPAAIGLFDAMILIPKDLEQSADAADVDRMVMHELAHLRRRDDWTNAIAQLIRSVLFFSPAIAFAVACLDSEREVACDDSVLLHDAEPLTYANTLARMTEIVAWPHRPLAAPGIFMTRRGISMRIERILEEGRDVREHLAGGPAASVLCAIAAISFTVAIAPSIALSSTENQPMAATPIDDAAPANVTYSGTWRLKYATGDSESASVSSESLFSGGDGSNGLLLDLHYPTGFSNWSIPADLAALGIDPRRLRAAEGPFSFVIKRDAGTFDCSGVAGGGTGHGEFLFHPNAAYAAAFASTGVKLSLRDQVIAGMSDVTLDYLHGIAAVGLTPMSFRSLIGLKMMGGSLDTVRALRSDFPNAGAEAITSFVMFQVHLSDAHALHTVFPSATIEDVTAMGMAHVTPDYVAALREAGVRGLSANNVTALRAAGVDKAFVQRMISGGKTSLTVDEVVALKKSGF